MVNYFLIPTSFLSSTPTHLNMPCLGFLIGQKTFLEMFVMCKLLQMTAMVFNNIVTCFDNDNFFSYIIHSISFASLLFPPTSFSQAHTHSFSWLFIFFPNHS